MKIRSSEQDEEPRTTRASDARWIGRASQPPAPQGETLPPRSGLAPRPEAIDPGSLAEAASQSPALPFFVVAVGASAGGLEASQDLFRHVGPASGLSFVLIQHLPPDFKSMLPQLLGRQTELQVLELEDGASPLPNCVHVAPPHCVVSLEQGRFRCIPRDAARVLMPINVFLTSLAEAQGDQSVAVILSGTGSDGTHGARVLKEAGGLVLAQEPASAKFDGMPNSVINSGSVDFVGTPMHLAERLQQYAQKAVERLASATGDLERERDAFEEILRVLRQQSRLHFTMYKPAMVLRRIQRRAGLVGEESLSSYAQYLKSRPPEVEQLTRELLIGVTQFFRDPFAWGYLEDTILPQVLALAGERGTLRLWVAGCATGEEAYTLAMLIEEQIQKLRRPINYRLFATDVRRDSLRYARAGAYPLEACDGIPEPLRERYFETRGEQLVARRVLRDAVTFAPHALLTDPPFTQLNLVVCRNLLIYLDAEAQRHVITRIRSSLKEGGFLFLGTSESVGDASPLYRSLNPRANVFLARGTPSNGHSVLPSLRELGADAVSGSTPPPRAATRSTESLYEAVLQRYAPPGVAVDSNFELIQVFGRVADFVSVPPGRVTISLLKMVPRPLAALLSTAGRKALSQGEEITIPEVRVPLHDGEQVYSIRIAPVEDLPGVALGLLIFFESPRAAAESTPVDPSELEGAARQRLRELEDELLVARENLNSAVQDLEASNEELQATNEELTASNEELQSTNEELQSVNEELYTVNSEYQEKIGELEEINADLENLLGAVDAGVLFLDERLTIRRFNDSATRLFPLRPEDVGRPLSEIAIQADKSLAQEAFDVLHSGERKSVTALGHDGAWWSIGLRVARDRSGKSGGGVIITLQEISELERARSQLARLQHAHELIENIAGTGHAVLDLTSEIVRLSENARRLLGLEEALPALDEVLDLFALQAGAPRERVLLELRLEKGLPLRAERTLSPRSGGELRVQLSVNVKLDPGSGAQLAFAVFRCIDAVA